MYSLADAISVKADWGHSSNIVGVELCQLAGVKHLCLFHHEPAFDDESIARVLADTRRSRRSRDRRAADGDRRLRRDGNRVVTSRRAREAADGRVGGAAASAWIGLAVLVALRCCSGARPPFVDAPAVAWFDAYQGSCRAPSSRRRPTVVEIDQKSLAGARPVAVAAHRAGAARRARSSAQAGRDRPRHPDARVRRAVRPSMARTLPTQDSELAQALARCRRTTPSSRARSRVAPVVLGDGRHARADRHAVFATPIVVEGAAKGAEVADASAVTRYAGALTSMRDARARGGRATASFRSRPSDGVMRRIPLVASIDGTLVPAFALEMLRVAREGAAHRG